MTEHYTDTTTEVTIPKWTDSMSRIHVHELMEVRQKYKERQNELLDDYFVEVQEINKRHLVEAMEVVSDDNG